MKLIKTEDAVGQVLCHDITQIIKGVTKDAVFPQGAHYHGGRYPGTSECRKRSYLHLGKR